MLAQYLDPERILLNIDGHNYRDILSKMLEKSTVLDVDATVDKILEREKIMPTALGKGIFLPRVVLDDIQRTEVHIAINHDGLVFDDYGTSVANVIMLFLFSKKDDHVALLAQSLRLLNDDSLRSDLLHCRKPGDVRKAVSDWEKE